MNYNIIFYIIGNIFCWFLLTLFFIQIIIINKTLRHYLKKIKVYKLSGYSKMGSLLGFISFIYLWVIMRPYMNFFNNSVWDLTFFYSTLKAYVLSLTFFHILAWVYGIFILLFVLINLKMVLRIKLKKSYIYLHQIPYFTEITYYICEKVISMNVNYVMQYLFFGSYENLNYSLIQQYKSKVYYYYNKSGFLYLYVFSFFMCMLYDVLFNHAVLIISHKIFPYYIVIVLLQQIQNFIVSRTKYYGILSDIYYNFDDPNPFNLDYTYSLLFLLEDCFVVITDLGIFHTIPEKEEFTINDEQFSSLDRNLFNSYKYNVYRLYLTDAHGEFHYQYLLEHVLTPDLKLSERLHRIEILKKIKKYPISVC